MNSIVLVLLTFAHVAQIRASLPANWRPFLVELVSRDRSIQDPAREKMTQQILPKLCEEDADSLQADVRTFLDQFEDDDGQIRQQVSAMLAVLVGCRSDSAFALSPALGAVIRHSADSLPRIRVNSVNYLAMLAPRIPREALDKLIEISSGTNDNLSELTMRGIARMAPFSVDAENVLDQAMHQTKSHRLQLAAVQSVVLVTASSSRIHNTLGELLRGTDPEIIGAALRSIRTLGKPAIAANRAAIVSISERFPASENDQLAEELVARLSATP